ncbi:MAG: DUF3365 domain-containing protein [Cyclobacteriaceae bacterium]
MKNFSFYSILLLLNILLSCEGNKRVDKSIVEEVTKANEVKKVSEAEIATFAMEWGDEISIAAQEALMGALGKAIEERGIEGAIGFCNEEALPITREVAEKYKVDVRRVSLKNRNPGNYPNENEKQILEAYAYNDENKQENRPNIQKIDEGETLLYTKAIKIPGGLCLNCHGEPGKEIQEETLESIQSLYPEDKAVNYKVGQLRGMWSISLPKKELIRNM